MRFDFVSNPLYTAATKHNHRGYLETVAPATKSKGALMSMKAFSPDGTLATVFTGIKRDGDNLVLSQLAAGEIPMDVVITPEEALKSVPLGCSTGLIAFVVLFPFLWVRSRRRAKASQKPT
jgi:hypothetical protein